MKRNIRKDIAVFVSIVLTLALCVTSLILKDELQAFEIKDYSGLSSPHVQIQDLISPGFNETYYEYKEEFEARKFMVDLSFTLSLLSLASTVLLVFARRPAREGLATKDHD